MRTSKHPASSARCKPSLLRAAAAGLLSSTAVLTALVAVPLDAHAKRGGFTRVVREPASGEPLTIIVSLNEQRLQVFDSRGVIAQSPISSGQPGYSTPTGIFSVLQKNRVHFSNLYYDAPMPNMQRITWSGVALHAGMLPGYPASHGCIRLPHAFARSLFEMTDIGTRVIVVDEMVEPQPFRHPRLFQALPPGRAEEAPPAQRLHQPNNASTAAGAGTVSAMLGVTPAVAAEAVIRVAAKPDGATANTGDPANAPRTRAMALAERQAEIDRRADIVAQQKDNHVEAADIAATTNERLRKARLDLRDARLAEPRLVREARDKERAKAAVERRLQEFIKQQSRLFASAEQRAEQRKQQHREDAASDRQPDDLLARVEQRNREAARDAQEREDAAATETALEADLLSRLHELDAAEMIVASQRNLIATHEEAVRVIEAELVEARKSYASARNALDLAEAEHKRAVHALQQFGKPATIFISRKSGTVRVRQGFEEVYQAPVSFAQPDARIGTHVFTAKRFLDGSETNLDWHVMTLTSIATNLQKKPRRGARTTSAVEVAETQAPMPDARNALDRIALSNEAQARITELIKPGSTVIISDEAASPETGKGTDIIVQPRS